VAPSLLAQFGRLSVEGAERLLIPSPEQAAVEASAVFAPEQVGVVIISSAERAAAADAVTATAVASLVDAPLLLVERDEVPPATHTELERLQPSHIVVVGGPMSVSLAVRQALAGYVRPVEPPPDDDVDL
jgi:putative cell wall-binding protein